MTRSRAAGSSAAGGLAPVPPNMRLANDPPRPRPAGAVGGGLQPERTALAWERTAIAMMVAGVGLARYGAISVHFTLGLAGVAQVAAGGVLLAWAGSHGENLHSLARDARAKPRVGLSRTIGLLAVAFNAAAFTLAVLVALGR